jgi:PAS domain S-box-containing protein
MKNTQGANLRIAILLPLLAIAALVLWAAADIAREGASLRRLSEAEATVKAEALAGKIREAKHIGLLADGLANLAEDAYGLLEIGGPTLAEVVQSGLSLHLLDSGGRVIGGLGDLPPPGDMLAVLRETRDLEDVGGDWIAAPYRCGAEFCASLLHAIDYRDPGHFPDWALIGFSLPIGIDRLPNAGSELLWRRRNGQAWLGGPAGERGIWFTLRPPLLDLYGLSLEVARPSEGWISLWWRYNGQRFLLLAGAILACFGLAGMLAARLARILREHRRTQTDLMARENQIRAVFDLVPDAFLVHDLGRVLFANPGAVRMLRAENLERLIGWNLFEIVEPEFREIARERTRRIQQDGIVPELARMQARRLDDSPMTIRVQGRPILFDGQQAVLSVFYDITEQDRIEAELGAARDAAETASKAKSEFLAHMSHELRTPLNSIIGFAELLDRQHLGKLGAPKYHEYVRDILDSGRHLLSLINAVLDWSRVEAGKLVLREEEVDLLALGRTCLRSLSEIAESRSVQLVDQLDIGPEPPLLLADARMARQVILNLLSNALKFTQPGGKASISIERDGQQNLVLIVRDNGIGIDPSDLARIFEPFVQADGSHKRRFEGTGLGLPLSRRLMEAHGGSLTLESQPGQGTVARMIFPAARVIEMPAHI